MMLIPLSINLLKNEFSQKVIYYETISELAPAGYSSPDGLHNGGKSGNHSHKRSAEYGNCC
jgi:hypothetical protein